MAMKRTALNTLLSEKKNRTSGGYYHKIQVDLAYNSNHIEGSRLTVDQTRYIFETRTVKGDAPVNDVIEAANHFRCFDFILDTVREPLSEEYIKNIHRILKSGIMEDSSEGVVIGEYKKYPNMIGDIRTALPNDVRKQMEKLITELNNKKNIDIYDIAEFHAEFEKIHPFYDGNGRVGRLLIIKLCLANDIIPFYIDDNSKMFYYMGLKEWQTMEKKERLIDLFLSMQDDMKGILDYFEIEYDRSDITARELLKKHEK